VDQGYVATSPAGHYVRLALIFFASVFGLLLLTFAFGSSSASADDGGPDDGGLVPAVAGAVGGAVQQVAPAVAALAPTSAPLSPPVSSVAHTVAVVTHAAPATTITTPVSGTVDGALLKVIGPTAIGGVLGTAPVGSVLAPLAAVLDTAVAGVGDSVVPALNVLPGLLTAWAGDSAAAAAASFVSTGAASSISGFAEGTWLSGAEPLGTGPLGTAGAPAGGSALPAAALGIGFLVLLFSRRLGLVNSALPVSPVYDTDTSPD
jgi:hypothetical protein